MTHQAMWDMSGLHGTYEAWQFGGDANQLADLVVQGIKTATASLNYWYETDPDEPMPQAGDYSVILNSDDEAVCIIRTNKVSIVPFCEVSPEHAYKEGEADRSLESWRRLHRDFFTTELSETGVAFREDMLVVCEEFEVVYK